MSGWLVRCLGSIALLTAPAAGCRTPPPSPPPPSAAPDAAVVEAPPVDAGPAPVAASPDRAECEQLIDHVLDIGLADQRRRKAPELVPTAEQVATIRAQLIDEQLDECLAMPRDQWQCVMAADSQESLYACAD